MTAQYDTLFDLPTVWRVSRSLAHHHDCTLHGIKARCGGACCRGPGGWPPSAGWREGHTACAMLGDEGCTFRPEDKPVTCLLYPLRLVRDMLDAHHRTRFPAGWCRGNFGQGPIMVDALRDNLIVLFGEEQIDALRVDVVAGRQGRLYPSEELLAQMAREQEQEERDVTPHPRSWPLMGPLPEWVPPAPVPGRVYLPIAPVEKKSKSAT